MLPATAIFTVLSPILIITGVVTLSIGIIYRIREQTITSLGFILLGLSFVSGLVALNKIDENLIVNYGWKYTIVKMLETGIIDPFKGAVSPGLVQLGSWIDATNTMIATSVFLVLGAILISYIGALMVGLETKKAVVVPIIVGIIGFAGVFYTSKSINLMLYQAPAPLALKARDTGAYLKAISILLAFLVATIGTGSLYLETRTKTYAFYAVSYLLGAIGWAIGSATWLTSFEEMGILQLIQTGQMTTPIKIFLVSAIFIIIGSVGLLLASIVDVISSASAGLEELEFEELEEIPEEAAVEEAEEAEEVVEGGEEEAEEEEKE